MAIHSAERKLNDLLRNGPRSDNATSMATEEAERRYESEHEARLIAEGDARLARELLDMERRNLGDARDRIKILEDECRRYEESMESMESEADKSRESNRQKDAVIDQLRRDLTSAQKTNDVLTENLKAEQMARQPESLPAAKPAEPQPIIIQPQADHPAYEMVITERDGNGYAQKMQFRPVRRE